jgi:hypothetical protein
MPSPGLEAWHRLRRVIPELAAGSFMIDPGTAIAKILTTYTGQMVVEMSAKGDQREALSRPVLPAPIARLPKRARSPKDDA